MGRTTTQAERATYSKGKACLARAAISGRLGCNFALQGSTTTANLAPGLPTGNKWSLFPNARCYHKHQIWYCLYQAERGIPPPYQVNSPWEGREEGTKEIAFQEGNKPRTEQADLRAEMSFYEMSQVESILALVTSHFLARSNAFQSKGYSRIVWAAAAAKCPHFLWLGANRPVRQTDRQEVSGTGTWRVCRQEKLRKGRTGYTWLSVGSKHPAPSLSVSTSYRYASLWNLDLVSAKRGIRFYQVLLPFNFSPSEYSFFTT